MEEGLFDEEEKKKKSKIIISLIVFMILTLVFSVTTFIFIGLYINATKNVKEENTISDKSGTDEPVYDQTKDRFIKILSKVTETGGAYVSQGKHDILNSKYYNFLDIYNMKSSGSLILLENFKTYQQTSEITCGIASLIMAIYYLDGTILNETDLAIRAKTDEHGTLCTNLEKVIVELGYTYESKRNFTNDKLPTNDCFEFSKYIKESLRNNESIIILSKDLGGHFTVIVGYDDMGTDYLDDDVIILADPYDTNDHISDGFTIFSFKRYYKQMQGNFAEEYEKLYFNKIKRKNKI